MDTQKIFRITVDYQTANANLEEVKRKLKELHEAGKDLVRQQQELERQRKSGALSEADYTEKLKENRLAMAENRQEITALNEGKRRATLETNKLAVAEKAGNGSMLQIQSRLIALRSQYRQLTEEERENAAVGGKMQRKIAQFANQYRKLEMSIGNTSANVGNYASVLNKAQGTFAVITAGLYGVQKAFQPFIDFEYKMDQVRAVSGATAEQFKQLAEDARRLGEATEYTASEVAELQLNYSRLGFSPEEIVQVTQATLDLATATGEDLARSADVAGATLRGFRLDSSEMSRVVDVMAASFNKSALQLSYFADAMKYVAPTAASAGVSLEQATAMLGVLADSGIRGTQAGTALRRILTEVSLSGKSVAEALADLNEKGLTVGGAMDEVGKYAMTALNVLANGATQVESLTTALNDSAGAAEQAAHVMRDNLQGDIDKLMSKLEGVAIWFGDFFGPVLRVLTQTFTALLDPIKAVAVALGAWFITLKTGTGIVTLYNAAKRTFRKGVADATVSLVSETAAMNVNTMAAKRNLVQIRSMPAATKAWAAAKLLLAGNFRAAAVAAKAFFASIGPIGWIAMAVGAVVGAMTAFSDATKKASEASSQLALELSQEKATHDDLKRAVTESAQGSKVRAEAIRLINERYKEYLPYLLTEKMSNEEIAAALDYVSQKMEENIKVRIRAQEMQRIQKEQFDVEREVLEKLVWAYENTGERTAREVGLATAAFGDLIQAYKESGDYAQFAAGVAKVCGAELYKSGRAAEQGWVEMHSKWGLTVVEFSKIEEAANKAAQEVAKLNALVSVQIKNNENGEEEKEVEILSIRVAKLQDSLKTAREKLQELRAADSKASEDDIENQVKKVADLEKQLETLTGKTNKTAEKIANKVQRQEENAAQKRAEFLLRQARKLEDIETQIVDMQVAAYEDGLNKKIIQAERAGQKELTQQQRANADLLAEMDKHIKAITDKGKRLSEEDEKQLKELNAQREKLVEAGGKIELAIIAKNTLAREKLMREANEKELTEFIAFQVKKGNYILANQADRALRKKKQEAHKAALLQEQEAYEKSIEQNEKYHALENLILANSAANTAKQRKANRKAQLTEDARFAQEQYDLYKKHLEDQAALGVKIPEDMLQHLNELKEGADAAGEQAKTTTWLGNLLGLDDDQVEQLKQAAFQVAGEIANTITQIGMENSQHQLKIETERIEKTKDKELKALDERKRKGVLSEKQYEKQKETIEKRAEAQKERAEREAFEREKRLKIQQVWMETALGVARIWAQSGINVVLGAIMSAALVATAGLQTAQIAAAKYAQGGLVEMYSNGPAASFGMIRGRSHAAGGNRLSIDGRPIAEVEGNETIVILRRGSEQFAPILSEMNASIGGRRFATGGIVRSPSLKIPAPAPVPRSLFSATASVETQLAGFREEMRATIQRLDANIQAVNTRIDNLRVHVVETDITDTQNSVRAMVQQATY